MSGNSDNLQRVACPLCGAADGETLFEGADLLHELPGRFGVERCRECGFAFTNPRPSPEAMPAFYPDDYSPHQAKPREKGGLGEAVRRAMLREFLGYPGGQGGVPRAALAPLYAAWRASDKNAMWLPWQGFGRVLDVGCGSGRFLERLAREGWQVKGLDISTAAAEVARKVYGVEVVVGTYPDRHFADESFDAVTMWNSLEHMFDPLGVLKSAAAVLAPGGRLSAGVPNFASFGAGHFRENWFPLDLPRHLNHFTPETLKGALGTGGAGIGGTAAAAADELAAEERAVRA